MIDTVYVVTVASAAASPILFRKEQRALDFVQAQITIGNACTIKPLDRVNLSPFQYDTLRAVVTQFDSGVDVIPRRGSREKQRMDFLVQAALLVAYEDGSYEPTDLGRSTFEALTLQRAVA